MANERRVDYAITATDTATAVYKKWKAEVDTGNKQIAGSFVDATGKLQAYGKETNSLTGYVRAQRAEQRQQNFFINEMRDAVSAAGLAVNIFSGMLGRGNSQVRELTNGLNAGIVAFQGINAVTGLLPGPWGLALSVIGGVAAALFTVGTESEEVKKKFNDLSLSIIDLKVKLGELPIAAKISFLKTDLEAAEQKFKDLSREMQFNLAVQDEFGAGGETIITKTVGSKEDIAEAEKAVLQLRLAIQELQGPYGPMPPLIDQIETAEPVIRRLTVTTNEWATIARANNREWLKTFTTVQGGIKQTATFMAGLTDQMKTELAAIVGAWLNFANSVGSIIGTTMSNALKGSTDTAKQFLKSIALMIIDMVQAALMAAAALVPLKGILSFGISVAPDLGALIAGTALLQAARAFVASFHTGGTVPHPGGGMTFGAPSNQQFPVLVRGGETFRTEQQEEDVQRRLNGGGATVIMNFYSAVPATEWVKQQVEEGMRRTGLAVDKFFINNRGTIRLGTV